MFLLDKIVLLQTFWLLFSSVVMPWIYWFNICMVLSVSLIIIFSNSLLGHLSILGVCRELNARDRSVIWLYCHHVYYSVSYLQYVVYFQTFRFQPAAFIFLSAAIYQYLVPLLFMIRDSLLFVFSLGCFLLLLNWVIA